MRCVIYQLPARGFEVLREVDGAQVQFSLWRNKPTPAGGRSIRLIGIFKTLKAALTYLDKEF